MLTTTAPPAPTEATPAAPEGSLTMAHESIDHVPTGPPMATILESADEIDLNEIIFTDAWCCPMAHAPAGVTLVTRIPKPKPPDDQSVLTGMSSGPPRPLINCGDDSSGDDSDVVPDNVMYYPWDNDMDANIDEDKEERRKATPWLVLLPSSSSSCCCRFLPLQRLVFSGQWDCFRTLPFAMLSTQIGGPLPFLCSGLTQSCGVRKDTLLYPRPKPRNSLSCLVESSPRALAEPEPVDHGSHLSTYLPHRG
jgi:hypothetical protein